MTSLLMTPFDVVKTRQQSQTLVRTKALGPAVRPWRASHRVAAGTHKGIKANAYSCLCDESGAKVVNTSGSGLRNSAALCFCPDSSSKHGFFTSSASRPGVAEAWRQMYRDLVSVPQGIARHRQVAASESVAVKGTLAGMRHIANTEGLRTLWRGLTPTLVASGPSTVIYFVGYDYLRQWIGHKVRMRPGWESREKYSALVAGCMARTAAVTAISPIELVRTRMQASASHDFGSVMRGISKEIRLHGIGSLWRGLVPTLWRDVPFSAVYWFGYERWRENVYVPLLAPDGEEEVARRVLVSFCSGASSGIVAAALTTPFDVAKTRRQVEQHADARSHVPQHRTLAQVVRHILATEGPKGLFAGLAPRLMKVAPSCALMISSYELGKLVLSS
ncbi:Carrier protein, mitochondrial [Coemansia sp. Benny D115]|nr:Carrier protein, mitochondrial [Coemansia sp. Benny D115]